MHSTLRENKRKPVKSLIIQTGMVAGVTGVMAVFGACAGELTVDGSMVVKTNLTVNGQLKCNTLALTNLTVSGETTLECAVIQHLAPQGDLGMGPYTNGVGH
jgi:hypothetical protein